MKVTSQLAKLYLEIAHKKGFLNKILNLIPRDRLWEYLGNDLKSEFARFASDGYDQLLYENHQIKDEDSVLVLGGFKGKSIRIWREIYHCKVIAYEPVPEFFNHLSQKFKHDEKVELYPFALSDRNEAMELALAEYGTSQFLQSKKRIEVWGKDIEGELKKHAQSPSIVEINIEGGEYAVLRRLLQTNRIGKIHTLVIQFHNYGLEQELARAQIRLELNKTHFCVFNYEWIWERWELRV